MRQGSEIGGQEVMMSSWDGVPVVMKPLVGNISAH